NTPHSPARIFQQSLRWCTTSRRSCHKSPMTISRSRQSARLSATSCAPTTTPLKGVVACPVISLLMGRFGRHCPRNESTDLLRSNARGGGNQGEKSGRGQGERVFYNLATK